MRRDWTSLPENVVTIISEKTCTNLQYVNLRTVCKEWWRALAPHPQHLCKGMWLQLPEDVSLRAGIGDPELSFYDVITCQTHQFRLPYLRGKHFFGSSRGWLTLEHDHRISLFNPITGISVVLPSLHPTILKVAISKRKSSVCSNQHEQYTCCVRKVVVSCSPSHQDCIVVAWFLLSSSSDWELGFCRVGDDLWTGLKRWEDKGLHLLDFTYHNNMVYTVNRRKEVLVYDLHDLSVRKFCSKIYTIRSKDQITLVEGGAVSGEPLIVRSTEQQGNTKKVVVYKWFNNIRKWRKVCNIGKQVIFLNRSRSVSLHSINLQTEKEQEKRQRENNEERLENKIYYNIMHSWIEHSYHVGINMVNLETETDIRHNPGPMEAFSAVSSSAMWFTPSII